MAAHPLAQVRGSDRLAVATSQTHATTPRRPPPCRSRPRASAAPLSVVRPFALASNESSDTCVLPFASQINHAPHRPRQPTIVRSKRKLSFAFREPSPRLAERHIRHVFCVHPR